MTDLHDHPKPEAESVKSVREEGWLLLKALSDSVGDDPPGTDDPQGRTGDDVPSADHDADCVCPNAWCPVRTAVAFVRQNPATLRHVTSSAASWLRSLADIIDQPHTEDERGDQ